MSLRAVKTLGFASWFQLSFAFFSLLIIVGIDGQKSLSID